MRSGTRNGRARPAVDRQSIDPAPISVRIPAAVKLTGISRSRLFELIRDGEIDSVKLGTSRLIIVSSLDRFLRRLQDGHVPRCSERAGMPQ